MDLIGNVKRSKIVTNLRISTNVTNTTKTKLKVYKVHKVIKYGYPCLPEGRRNNIEILITKTQNSDLNWCQFVISSTSQF